MQGGGGMRWSHRPLLLPTGREQALGRPQSLQSAVVGRSSPNVLISEAPSESQEEEESSCRRFKLMWNKRIQKRHRTGGSGKNMKVIIEHPTVGTTKSTNPQKKAGERRD